MEIDAIENNFDSNYNVKVSNTFSPLEVLGEESTVTLATILDEESNVKTINPVELGSDLQTPCPPACSSETLHGTQSPRPPDSDSKDTATGLSPTDCKG